MYRVIAYHGEGNNEVKNDLRLLWENLRNFAKSKKLEHIYCFQSIKDNKGANLLLVVQYEDTSVSKVEPRAGYVRYVRSSTLDTAKEGVDYWFFVREGKRKV